MRQYRYCIHWLSFVVDGTKENAFNLYSLFFEELFGKLENMGNGGRGFKEIWFSLLGFKVYVSPSRGEKDYFHFEIPGQACELIHWEIFQGMEEILASNYPGQYHYSRLDFAFDDLPFTPREIEEVIKKGDVKSSAKRKTLAVKQSPFEKKDNGEEGTYTVYFGSRSSERMVRVYDRRGFTRLELEMKGKRADLVAKELLGASNVEELFPIGLSHLQDYIKFDAAWWEEFVNGVGRAHAIVSTPREVSEETTAAWLAHQVAPALSVLHDIHPDYFTEDLLNWGRIKRKGNKKYDLLLKGNKNNLLKGE